VVGILAVKLPGDLLEHILVAVEPTDSRAAGLHLDNCFGGATSSLSVKQRDGCASTSDSSAVGSPPRDSIPIPASPPSRLYLRIQCLYVLSGTVLSSIVVAGPHFQGWGQGGFTNIRVRMLFVEAFFSFFVFFIHVLKGNFMGSRKAEM
jgi:hypothetical protein